MRLFRTKKEFFAAIATGDAAMVHDYLNKSRDWLDKTGKNDASPAHIAAEHGQLEILRILLAAKPKLATTTDGTRRLPLHTATEHGKADIVNELLTAHKQAASINTPDYGGATPLQDAITFNRVDILKIFLATGKADLKRDNPPALYHAVSKGKRDCVKVLLEAGASPNTPHVVPARTSFSIFFDYDRPKNILHSPLMRAIEIDSTNIALDLMDAGGKTEQTEYPLHAAALNANLVIARALLDGQHVDVDRRNHENRTALHVAAERNVPEMVQFLLERGAKTDVLNIDGETPMDVARKYARKEIIDLMRGPRPAAPVKPADRTPPEIKKPPAAVQTAAPIKAANENAPVNTWELNAARDTLVHTHTMPDGLRKLTEIFNFANRERVVISENLKTGAESMGPHESFDNISEESLTTAWGIFKAKGGRADEDAVFKGRILKPQMPKRK